MRVIGTYVGILFLLALVAYGDAADAAVCTLRVSATVLGMLPGAVMFRDRVLGRWV